jgi:hypothetical protein
MLNLTDCPADPLARFDVEAQHPDHFLRCGLRLVRPYSVGCGESRAVIDLL